METLLSYSEEHTILLKLKQHWSNPPSINHWTPSSLSSNSTHCDWSEITCTNGSISGLALMNKSITAGTVPPFICNLKNLITPDLQYNYLSGQFPKSLYNCSKLEYLVLSNNYVFGSIPDDVDRLSPQLRYLNLSANNFTGDIPAAIGRLPELEILDLSSNDLSGNIPSGLFLLKNLTTLYLYKNHLSGVIPNWVVYWNSLSVFQASNNLFSGSISQGLTGLPLLTTLLLDRNQLSGHFPSDILFWSSLTTLNLSQNKLSGSILATIGFLPILTDLDLFENEFLGQILPKIGLLRLTSLNLSSNRLTGRIPDEFEMAIFYANFLNNSGLCASNPLFELNVCSSGLPNWIKLSSNPFAIVASIVAIIFVLSLLSLFFIKRVKRKGKHETILTWNLTAFQMLDFTESDIVSSLTESNVIGKGGSGKVYHVAVNRSGIFVAVKRIWNSKKLDQRRSFW
ncbi:hypothetical protein ACSBR2_038480 [Camellia fascicularis]